ncbi:MAG: ankyrin repeat domain-containing protein [Candidatus Omnitrophica bacterium]|nr:ankyrin repeat domain-containing protein [Candidatus Omnitrophota bacterium]MBU4479402.1 ankyrin repeat domain-containing protein [Candidatus Omnitrophota bacterium]
MRYGRGKNFRYALIVFSLFVLAGCATVPVTNIPGAASNGDLSSVSWMVEQGYDLNASGGISNQTGLHYAAAGGNIEMLKVLLNAGANINAQDSYGFTPLMIALYKKRHEAAELLLQRGADVKIVNTWNKFTALHYAVVYSTPEIVQMVLNARPDVNAKESRGLTAADFAKKYGNIEVLGMLKKNGVDIPYFGDKNKDIVLAVTTGDREKIKSLIDEGANVNARDKSGTTLLMKAVNNNWPDIVEMLLRKGADAAVKDKDGWTPAMHAAKDAQAEILKVFDRAGIKPAYSGKKKDDVLLAVLFRDNGKLAELLSAKGIDVNARYRKNSCLLNYAINNNNKDIALLLLDKKANPNLLNDYGFSPLLLASTRNSPEMAELLIDHGADINLKNDQGMTALHYAASAGSLDMVTFLAGRGADVNALNAGKCTPLMSALGTMRNLEVARYLLPKTADVDIKDTSGYSVLMYAVITGDVDLVKSIVDRGVEPDYYTVLLSEGKNKHYAKINFPEITALLKPQALRRQLLRAQAAVESAQSAQDYQNAIAEYRIAQDMAPEFPDTYYNVGVIQDKSGLYNDAIKSLRKYLELTPNSTDSQAVKDLIYKIEYKRDAGK